MGLILPSEYQQVEYLEKAITTTITRDVYIDTGIFVSGKVDYEFDGKVLGNYETVTFFGASKAFKDKYLELVYTLHHDSVATGAQFRYASEPNTSIILETPAVNIYEVKHYAKNGGTFTCNNSFKTIEEKTFSYNKTITLFDVNRGSGIVGNNGGARIYYFKLYEDGELVRSFIPCYRKSDSKPGMYDLVTKQFFTNAGTGEFVVGPDVIDSISPLMVAWRRAMMQNVKSARLPREYQEVEYIEGTGTQYINIDSTDQRYEMECECLFPSSRTNGAMLWGGSSFSDSDAWALFQSSSALALRRRNNGNSDCSLSNNVYINKKIHVELFESHCRFSDEDGEVLAEKVATKQKQYTTYMWLFHGYSNGGYSTRYVSARLYWMKVYINGTLVYHLIPCYRKGDGEIGVYDLINNRFNANNGTGVFLKGKNV